MRCDWTEDAVSTYKDFEATYIDLLGVDTSTIHLVALSVIINPAYTAGKTPIIQWYIETYGGQDLHQFMIEFFGEDNWNSVDWKDIVCFFAQYGYWDEFTAPLQRSILLAGMVHPSANLYRSPQISWAWCLSIIVFKLDNKEPTLVRQFISQLSNLFVYHCGDIQQRLAQTKEHKAYAYYKSLTAKRECSTTEEQPTTCFGYENIDRGVV